MYGAEAAIASLAHEPLCQGTICSPDVPILQYCADNRAKSATSSFELHADRRRRSGAMP